MLDDKNPQIYAFIMAATLKKKIIQRNVFENIEANKILASINELTSGTKVADLKYLVINSFESMRDNDFFTKQEIFLGSSFCDICLNDADEIEKAILNHDIKSEDD